jgi:hypothetical protein
MPWELRYVAFKKIISQCFGTQNGGGYHYDNHWLVIDRCIA